jgi:hypothetical protein
MRFRPVYGLRFGVAESDSPKQWRIESDVAGGRAGLPEAFGACTLITGVRRKLFLRVREGFFGGQIDGVPKRRRL